MSEGMIRRLVGVRVVDMSHVLVGLYSMFLLRQLGAEELRAQPLRCDEPSRDLLASDGMDPIPVGVDVAYGRMRLPAKVVSADVVVQMMYAGSARRLGVLPVNPLAANPDPVVVHVQGCTSGMAHADLGAYDQVIQAVSRFMALTGAPEGQLMRAGVRLSDLAAGLWAVIAAVSGLVCRSRHEQNGQLEMLMLDASPSIVPHTAPGAMTQGADRERISKRHPGVAPYGSFHAADGHLVVTVFRDKHWLPRCRTLALCRPAADPGLAAQPTRVARRKATSRCLPEVVGEMVSGQGASARQAHDVPCSPVLGVNEALRADYNVPRQLGVLPQDGDIMCAVVAPAVRGIAFPSAP